MELNAGGFQFIQTLASMCVTGSSVALLAVSDALSNTFKLLPLSLRAERLDGQCRIDGVSQLRQRQMSFSRLGLFQPLTG